MGDGILFGANNCVLKPQTKLFTLLGADARIEKNVSETKTILEKITEQNFTVAKVNRADDVMDGILFSTFDALSLTDEIKEYKDKLNDTDGYAVLQVGKAVYVLSHTVSGVIYGIYGFLEENFQVVFARGANEYPFDYISSPFEIKKYNYLEKSPFRFRVWNMCGTGSTGEGHVDDGTAKYYGKNKINGIFHSSKKEWKDYGINGFGVVTPYANDIDFLMDEHPEYFMTDIDGKPKKAQSESFINYYNLEVAKIVAKRFVDFLDKQGDKDFIYNLIMPDNPYFCMVEGGVKISEEPFTTDYGVTVYPKDKNYKSTVYFNYMNRVAREVDRLRPGTEFITFAYLYSETVPAIEIEQNLLVSLAPIYTNEKYAYNDTRKGTGNEAIKENIEKWSKVCKKLCIYTYWNSFQGTIYMRPILRQVKQNLLWFRDLGICGLTPEGKLDCSLVENMTDGQKSARKFFDMNEACTYVMNKLMWNPDLDVDKLLERFAKIVYKETAQEFLEYYYLIEKGYNHKDAYVWYPTGGDVYNLQFVVEAGIKDKVLELLDHGEQKAVLPSVKERIASINQTVKEQMKKYGNFVREEGSITYCSAGEQVILSQSQLDYRSNAESVWNTAVPLKVLRNYSTMEFYPKEADFECRMLLDDKNLYVGYSVMDERIEKVVKEENGYVKVFDSR